MTKLTIESLETAVKLMKADAVVLVRKTPMYLEVKAFECYTAQKMAAFALLLVKELENVN